MRVQHHWPKAYERVVRYIPVERLCLGEAPLDGALASARAAFAEEEPVQRYVLADGQGDQEVRMWRRAALVPVDVLLEDTEVFCKCTLRALSAKSFDALRNLLLEAFQARTAKGCALRVLWGGLAASHDIPFI